MDDIEAGVLAIIRSFVGRHARIDLSTELYHDLHIHGDDAGEMLDEVYDKFKPSFEGFKFNAFFPNETEALPRFAKWLGFRDRTVGSFTVAHLIAIVRQGRWTDPTPTI